MAIESEFKFLVTRLPALPAVPGVEILQAYLSTDGPMTTRIRLKGAKAFLTLKGDVTNAGALGHALSRPEFEYEVPVAEAREMIALSPLRVEKRRYVLPSGMELDVFSGRLRGLVLAEMEGPADAPPPPVPDGWEWQDVTHDRRFSNRALAELGIPPGTPLAGLALTSE